jgi:hypothetical protein
MSGAAQRTVARSAYLRSVKRFLDGAGVLATSVRLVNERALNKAELVAITHPDVKYAEAPEFTSRPRSRCLRQARAAPSAFTEAGTVPPWHAWHTVPCALDL